MDLYTTIDQVLDHASARRDESRHSRDETEPSEQDRNRTRASSTQTTSTGQASGGEESTPNGQGSEVESAIGAGQRINEAISAAGLPGHAGLKAISYVVKLRAEKSRSALMLESLLLSSVAQFEVFVSKMIRVSLKVDPSPLKGSEKTYTFKDVAAHPSLEAFNAAVANSYVDAQMYKGMDSWMKFLSKATRTDMDWIADSLAEVVMRRNVHVHAGGRASQQYLSELGKRAAAVNLGDDLPVNEEYLEDALNRMARATLVLSQAGIAAICASAKADKQVKHSIDQDKGLVAATFDLLSAGRFGALEALASQLDPFVSTNATRERLRANSLAARKQLFGLAAIAGDLDAWDVSAAEDELVLAKYCLAEEIDKAQNLYDSLVAADKISVMELATWPVLEPLRVAIETAQKAPEAPDTAEEGGD